jgi:hypothetical protein
MHQEKQYNGTMVLPRAGGIVFRFVALFRSDVFIEVATLTNTESIHASSVRVTMIVSSASSVQGRLDCQCES